jgi:hypothetical protein
MQAPTSFILLHVSVFFHNLSEYAWPEQKASIENEVMRIRKFSSHFVVPNAASPVPGPYLLSFSRFICSLLLLLLLFPSH